MATLILTAVGSAIGGTVGAVGAAVGGAIGALAGRSIDGLIFRPGGRTGPRLAELQVQTSRYGAHIPRLYGTIRAAGTVIWSTDLKEASSTSGGGKGQPSVTRYSYSASFAVALSSRRVTGIGRIWADGNLLRGAAGDFKAPLGAFRLHDGGEEQPVDPLIAAAIGSGLTPAYRDCAYAVFEDLQLADYGNRIPSLTFEVIADTAPVDLPALMSDLAGRAIICEGDEDTPVLAGFAAEGEDLRAASAPLTHIHDLLWRERDGAITLTAGRWSGRRLGAADAAALVDGEQLPSGAVQRAPIETVPLRLALRHHDPARDYQAGSQTAERPGPGRLAETLDLPVVMEATQARRLADRKLRALMRRRSVLRHSADWTALDLAVGDIIALDDRPGRWLVETCEWDDMAVRLMLRAIETGSRPAAEAGAPGAPVLEADRVQGATSLAIVEMPPDGITLASAPVVLAAATGADAGWRRAALLRYRPETGTAEPIGPTAPRAVLGIAESILPDGAPWRIDRRGTVDILLDNEADALVPAADELLLQGANLCQIGNEVLQFGAAEPIGPKRYRLSHLLRGWHGTEWAMAGHVAEERFVLLDAARLVAVDLSAGDVGQALALRAIGSGDAVPAEAARMIDGRAMLPPAPVHGRITLLAGGDRSITWIRRSRLGWAWPDLGDVPIGEEREAYVLRVTASAIVLREWESEAPTALYTAAQADEDVLAAAPASPKIEIRQKGTWGLSRPLVLALP